MNQMMACSCGALFEEGDAFCPNCGKPRVLTAPPPVDDRIPGPPSTVPQPVVPQAGIPDEQPRGDGRRLSGQHREERISITQSRESISPSPFDAETIYLQETERPS
jgi:hypothetical protein